MTVTLITSPDLKRTVSWTAPIRAVTAPIQTFRLQASHPRPVPVLTSVILLTAASTATVGPVMSQLLQDTPGVNASSSVANQFVLAQIFFLAPIGTVTFLCAITLWIWWYVVITGGDTTLPHAAAVTFTAGVAGVLKRLFVALVLHLRLLINPSQLSADVTSGLDGFVSRETVGDVLFNVFQQMGIFEIWFFVLLGIGLRYTCGLTTRRALLAAVASALIVTTARTAFSAAVG